MASSSDRVETRTECRARSAPRYQFLELRELNIVLRKCTQPNRFVTMGFGERTGFQSKLGTHLSKMEKRRMAIGGCYLVSELRGSMRDNSSGSTSSSSLATQSARNPVSLAGKPRKSHELVLALLARSRARLVQHCNQIVRGQIAPAATTSRPNMS